MRVHFAARLAAVAALCGAVGYQGGTAVSGTVGAQRVPLAASKFAFSATAVRARKGAPLTLVLSTTDFVHGFSIPDLGVRVDLVPGKTVELTLTPQRAGEFVFLCDNFCGEGHDAMTGKLIVSDE